MMTRPEPGPVPTVPGYADVRRLPGGHTHELFLASGPDGSEVVLRVFGAGTRQRGPEAPAVQAGVLRLVHGLVPAPVLLEQRADLLVTTKLGGTNLRAVLRTASPTTQERLGTAMGEVLGRLTGIALTGPGGFLDDQQRLAPYEPAANSLVTWLDDHWSGTALEALGRQGYDALVDVAFRADSLLATSRRAVLVHGDLSPRNVLCDPESGEITGVVDWEFAHAGHPVEDAGKLIRRHPATPFADAALAALNTWLPAREQACVDDLRERARAADFYWLLEVASRRGASSATERAWRIVHAIARSGDLLGDVRRS